jgi:hypothetical protein
VEVIGTDGIESAIRPLAEGDALGAEAIVDVITEPAR